MTLGTKLQNLRKSKNMSQENLAETLNVSRQAVSKWELDQSLPDTSNIIAISNLFNVSIDYLLLDKEPTSAVNEKNTSKKYIFLICGIVSSATGFIGSFILYVISRFIKVPVMVPSRIDEDGSIWYTFRDGYDFFSFVSHHKLKLLFTFFLILFILGIVLISYKYRTEIKSFISKLSVKLKSLIKKSK